MEKKIKRAKSLIISLSIINNIIILIIKLIILMKIFIRIKYRKLNLYYFRYSNRFLKIKM